MAMHLYTLLLHLLECSYFIIVLLSKSSASFSFPKAFPINLVVSLNLKTVSVETVGAILDN